MARRVEGRLPFAGIPVVVSDEDLGVGLICNAVQVRKEQHWLAALRPVEHLRDLVGLCFFVPLHTIDRNRRIFIDRHDAVQMPRTADNVLLVDLSDEGVFKEHCLIGFPQPRGEACLEALVKQPADITEICRAKHCHWKVDPVSQPSQRSLGLRRKGILRRLGFRRFSVRPWGQRYRFGASLLVIGFFLPSPLRTGAQGKQQSRRQQQRAYPFAYSFHGRALRIFRSDRSLRRRTRFGCCSHWKSCARSSDWRSSYG